MSIVETEQPIRSREIKIFLTAINERTLVGSKTAADIQKKGLSRKSIVSTVDTKI